MARERWAGGRTNGEKATAQNFSQAFRSRLNKALRTRLGGLVRGTGRGTEPRPPRPKQDIELYDEPTTMTGPEEVTLLAEGRAAAFLEINARDGFVPDRGTILLVGRDGGSEPQVGIGDLRRGRLRLTLVGSADLVLGMHEVDVSLEWLRSSGGLGRITWPLRVNVVAEIPPASPGKPAKGNAAARGQNGDIAIIWSTSAEEGWTDEVVGDLQEIKGSDLATRGYPDPKNVDTPVPTLVLNRDFSDWASYRRSVVKHLTEASLAIREERYGLGVWVTVANLELRERKIRTKHEAWKARQNGAEEPPKPMSTDQLQRALAEAARGVVALMPDFDQLLNDFDER